jgi:tRNA (guanine-N7-)-methyltransferase
MRPRTIKNVEQRLAAHSHLLITDPAAHRGEWRGVFGEAPPETTAAGRKPLRLELGCGKGRFLFETALRDPNGLYIGFEGQEGILCRAFEKVGQARIPNARFCAVQVLDTRTYFADAELSGIYLNFSDPWPKARHAKRRLTSEQYLKGYLRVLEPGGFLQLKTDDDAFCAYSRAGIEAFSEFEIVAYTEDLHRSVYARGNIMTEYERKFLNLNKRIKYLLARRL